MTTENKPTVASQSNALNESLARLKQVATAFAPAFIELARGAQTGYTQPNRAGLKGVSHLIGLILVSHAQNVVLSGLLVQAGVVKPEELDALLASEYQKDAKRLAEALNDGSLDLKHGFRFTEVPVSEPKPDGDGK